MRFMTKSPIDVGPQDPELRNSPIAWEYLDEEDWPGTAEEEQPGCFFNGVAYSNGTIIRADDAVLECGNGFWIPVSTDDSAPP
jgi:hypothetical protein